MPLIATPGDPDANSFASVAYADAYHSMRPFSTWATLTTPQKEAGLISATRVLQGVPWRGRAVTATQALAFPRTGLLRNGHAIDTTIVPRELADATSELAYLNALTDAGAQSDAQAQGITKIKAGPMELNFSEKKVEASVMPSSILPFIPIAWYTEPTGNRFRFEVF